MKIVILDGHTLNPGDLDWQPLEQLGKLQVYDRTAPEQIMERSKGAQAVIVNKVKLDKNILGQLKDLKYIGVSATGFDIVDTEFASKQKITVTNVPGYGTSAVAQHTFALVLEACNHTGLHIADVKEGGWANNSDWCYWKKSLLELHGKNLGIVGFGRIGSAVAKIARAFGMNILVYNPGRKKQLPERATSLALEELLQKSDFISLHCPLTNSNQQFINRNTLGLMKKSAWLINTSRGGLINEADLAQGLKKQIIAGAALDVLAQEPPPADHPLLHLSNCFITPHQAWCAKESRQRLLNTLVQNLKQYLLNKPVNVVNR